MSPPFLRSKLIRSSMFCLAAAAVSFLMVFVDVLCFSRLTLQSARMCALADMTIFDVWFFAREGFV